MAARGGFLPPPLDKNKKTHPRPPPHRAAVQTERRAPQLELREASGNKAKLEVTYTAKFTDELVGELMTQYGARLKDAMLTTGKFPRYAALKALKAEIVASVPAEDTERLASVGAAW